MSASSRQCKRKRCYLQAILNDVRSSPTFCGNDFVPKHVIISNQPKLFQDREKQTTLRYCIIVKICTLHTNHFCQWNRYIYVHCLFLQKMACSFDHLTLLLVPCLSRSIGRGSISAAESVAISLLRRFSEKHLPKASDLVWLVSEQDAPQAVSKGGE